MLRKTAKQEIITIDFNQPISSEQAMILERLIQHSRQTLLKGSFYMLSCWASHRVETADGVIDIQLSRSVLVMADEVYLVNATLKSQEVLQTCQNYLGFSLPKYADLLKTFFLDRKIEIAAQTKSCTETPVSIYYIEVKEIDPLAMDKLEANFLAQYLQFQLTTRDKLFGAVSGIFCFPNERPLLFTLDNTTCQLMLSLRLTHGLVSRKSHRHPELMRYEVIGERIATPSSTEGLPLGVYRSLGRLIPDAHFTMLRLKQTNLNVVKIQRSRSVYQNQIRNIKQKYLSSKILSPIFSELANTTKALDILVRRWTAMHVKPTSYVYLPNSKRLISVQVMRHVAGKTLFDLIQDDRSKRRGEKSGHPLAAIELIRLARECALAVLEQTIHLGMVHNDIKPENMMVSDDGRRVRLIDGDTLTTLHGTGYGLLGIGTLGYLGAEHLFEHGHIGPKSDVYSLYVVLKLLFGGEQELTHDLDSAKQLSLLSVRHVMFAGLFAGIFDLTFQEKDKIKNLLYSMSRPVPQDRCSLEEVVNCLESFILERDRGFGLVEPALLLDTYTVAQFFRSELWRMALHKSWNDLTHLDQLVGLFSDSAKWRVLEDNEYCVSYFVQTLHCPLLYNFTNKAAISNFVASLVADVKDFLIDIKNMSNIANDYQERLQAFVDKWGTSLYRDAIFDRIRAVENIYTHLTMTYQEYNFTIDHLYLLVYGEPGHEGKLLKALNQQYRYLDCIADMIQELELGFSRIHCGLPESSESEIYHIEGGYLPRGRFGYERHHAGDQLPDPRQSGVSRVAIPISRSTGASPIFSLFGRGAGQAYSPSPDSDDSLLSKSSRSNSVDSTQNDRGLRLRHSM